MNKHEYRNYLQSGEWQGIKRLVNQRANNRCQLCNGTGVLHVHHRTYDRIMNEHPDDLILLCEKCHSRFHDLGGREPDILYAGYGIIFRIWYLLLHGWDLLSTEEGVVLRSYEDPDDTCLKYAKELQDYRETTYEWLSTWMPIIGYLQPKKDEEKISHIFYLSDEEMSPDGPFMSITKKESE